MMIVSGVAATLAMAGLALVAHLPPRGATAEQEASLSQGGASIDDGPVPAVASSYDLSAHQTLSRVVLLIRENYVEPERINPYAMFLAALDYIQKTVPEVIVDDTQAPEHIKIFAGAAEQTFDLGGLDQLWEVTMALRDIFRFLQTQLPDPEQRRDIEFAAINGMLSTLDPHSVLLKPESFDEVKLSTKGEFGGLGIVISIRDGSLTVISPIEGTPASRAGIKTKDKIVKIGEESTVNMNLEEAVQRLRGKPGSKVNIWVLRKGWSEARRYLLTRANIKIESVSSELLADGVGYLKLKSFQNNTYDDLHDHLEALRKKNQHELKGLVLDLRNNPGGLLDQAIYVSDRFIEEGPLVITVGEGNRKREEKMAHAAGTERDYPIVVLVNGGSASASEIVSGALKNHNRALVIGQQTFGKGSVQVLYDFKDKSALKLTIAQYLTPGDESIQSIGITPDVEVVPATISKDALHLFVDDDSPREKDLDHHLAQHGSVTPTGATTGEGEQHVEAASRGGSASGGRAESAVRLVHLAADTEPAPRDDGAAPEEPAPPKFDYDFEIRLAHDVLAAVKTGNRPALLAGASALFKARAADEERRMEQRFLALGVNWAPGPSSGIPSARITLDVANKSKTAVRAGDTVTLLATVKNTGMAPLYRVHAVSESDNPLFKNLEFAFGLLAPSESKSWSVDVKLPEDLMSRADTVTLHLGEEDGALAAIASPVLVSIDEAAKPRFAFTARLDDRAPGNGDGVLQAGEKVDLNVEVTNLGPGEAKEALVTLKNLAGETVFLERGREKLGVLRSGQSKSATFKFGLREGSAGVDVAALRLTIWDNVLGAVTSEALNLPVLGPRKAQLDAKMLKVQPSGDVPIYAGAATASAIIGFAHAGALLKSDARFEPNWRRVEVAVGAFGFVRDDDAKQAKGSVRSSVKTALALVDLESAPVIDLGQLPLVTSEGVVRLRGTMVDAHPLKDVFVFVNDKKVYYHAFGVAKASDAAAERGPAPETREALDVSVPLKAGANSVTIVVRQDQDLMVRRAFGVFRAPADAVAELRGADAAGSAHDGSPTALP